MNDLTSLKKCTRDFFDKHWDKKSKHEFPVWSAKWKFEGELPNNQFAGCYAWLKEDVVMYVGFAMNAGQKGYEGHSLGTRIGKYWKFERIETVEIAKRQYMPIEQLKQYGIQSIITLPFQKGDQEYLAAALELYLIKNISPELNKHYK